MQSRLYCKARKVNKVASKSGLKSLKVGKESCGTRNEVVLTYTSQNLFFSGSDLPL